ncbi:hypothetical protein AXG93_3911s1790 [Marchantia polymorpha subsp. ruderalis]|uniref:Uncharacterized protein n=1 Tax=Marchantia polymorpha subsp. ruderalis TaxID=1480154 RepID=A0A176W5K9_MARPO|nr:hypothetical protein AXG93_3911s1790 [Marchantia polymorpha subsp. ruderalis]
MLFVVAVEYKKTYTFAVVDGRNACAEESEDTTEKEGNDEWPSEWRLSDVSKERPLAECEEKENKTKTETLSQPQAISSEDLWPLCGTNSDVREEIEKSLEVTPSDEGSSG